MRNHALILLGATILATALLGCAWAQEKKLDFDDPQSLAAWETTGDVARDTARNRGAGPGLALRVGPGGKAIWRLRDNDGAGKVELWVYDDLTIPTDARARRAGPRWGLIQSDGRVLVIGPIYAPYLSGGTTYATSDSDQKNWFDVQFSALKRQEGWHKWTFDFDADKGLSIAQNDKSKARFDWNKSKIKGFRGIAIFGDNGQDKPQTIWIDDVAVALGGDVKAQPVAPPPAPSVVPATDPAPEKVVQLVPSVRGKHPRLLFTAEDVPAMKKLAAGQGKVFFEQLQGYLGASVPPKDTKFADDATEAQRQAFWRLPTVALHYVLTGDQKSFANARESL